MDVWIYFSLVTLGASTLIAYALKRYYETYFTKQK